MSEEDTIKQDMENLYHDFLVISIALVLSKVELTLELRDKAEEILSQTGKGEFRDRVAAMRKLREDARKWNEHIGEVGHGEE